MNRLARAFSFLRFVKRSASFLRDLPTPDQAVDVVRTQIENREDNFLEVCRRYVYGNERSPYRVLLARAGCEFGDLDTAVRRVGLEPTLRTLLSEGVYLSFEEYKGRTPVVRGDVVFDLDPTTLDRPDITASFISATSGSTGPASLIHFSLDAAAADVPSRVLGYLAHDVIGSRAATWLPPAGAIGNVGVDAALGQPHDWCYVTHDLKRARNLYRFSRLPAWRAGIRLPPLRQLNIEQAAVLARWAADRVASDGRALLATMVSHAVRIAGAATDAGLDLTGLSVWAGGEPVTPAKTKILRAAGAKWLSHYGLAEIGGVGMSCASVEDGDDYHALDNHVAITPKKRLSPDGVFEVDTFHLTTLLPTTTKVMLNVEVDDYGTIEERSCRCFLGSLGLNRHITGISSFAKLTTEGVTLLDVELVRVLEDVLPARFGGTPLDYQLVEEEDERGLTRLVLHISPRLDITDDSAVVRALLDGLGTSALNADVRRIWSQSDTVTVRRSQPSLSAGAKFKPIVRLVARTKTN